MNQVPGRGEARPVILRFQDGTDLPLKDSHLDLPKKGTTTSLQVGGAYAPGLLGQTARPAIPRFQRLVSPPARTCLTPDLPRSHGILSAGRRRQ